MDLHVVPDGDGWAAVLDDGRSWPCVVGRAGVTRAKHEGDGATPAGTWPVRRIHYRPDRVMAPWTACPVLPIARDDGWCDDPRSTTYNRPVKLPCTASHEVLWRDDGLYDLLAVLGYNDDPPVPGAGSAVFLHCMAPDGAPTAGCVAVAREALTAIASDLTADSAVVIHPA